MKKVVEKSAAGTNSAVKEQSGNVEKKVDALTKTVASLQKTIKEQPKQVVVEKPVVSSALASANQSTSKHTIAVNVSPIAVKMKLMVTDIDGEGQFWGPMTNDWEHWPLNNGVGEFSQIEGDFWINGRIGNKYLDKVVLYNLGMVKVVAENGQEHVYTKNDIVYDHKNRPNLATSYLSGSFSK